MPQHLVHLLHFSKGLPVMPRGHTQIGLPLSNSQKAPSPQGAFSQGLVGILHACIGSPRYPGGHRQVALCLDTSQMASWPHWHGSWHWLLMQAWEGGQALLSWQPTAGRKHRNRSVWETYCFRWRNWQHPNKIYGSKAWKHQNTSSWGYSVSSKPQL